LDVTAQKNQKRGATGGTNRSRSRWVAHLSIVKDSTNHEGHRCAHRHEAAHLSERKMAATGALTDPVIYHRACTYATLGSATLTIGVFHNVDEAASG
jgi:hypothetical protein